jgi:hypothetical protein
MRVLAVKHTDAHARNPHATPTRTLPSGVGGYPLPPSATIAPSTTVTDAIMTSTALDSV